MGFLNNKLKKNTIFKHIVELSDRPVIISTIKGKYIYANQSYLSVRQKDKIDLIGKYWWDTFSNMKLALKIKNQFIDIIKNGEYFYSAEYNIAHDKSVFIDWNAMLIDSKEYGGKVIIEYGKDVSEKKILESQLMHMQKLDSLGTLAGGIAHEFNNILTSIIGYSSFLKNLFESGSKERRYVDKIQKSSLGAAKLTSKLLGFARKGEHFEKLLNPNEIVREVYEIIQKTISKKINIKIDLLDGSKFILADYDQIFQSIMNLVINASDAMENGGELTISTFIKTFAKDKDMKKDGYIIKKGDYFAISVKDTGVGMDDKLKDKILEPFFTTKPEGKGTGLGMPMVYGVAKSHKGHLFIESELNKGSIITLSLPLAVKQGVEPISEESGVFPVFKIKEIKKILIVDDDKQILDYLNSVLTEYGYSIKTALNGEDAYAIINSEADIDLVLLDLILPKLGGEELIEKLESDSNNVKVVVMTSFPDDEKIEKLKLSGISYFLFKPFKVSNLINLIKNIFENNEI